MKLIQIIIFWCISFPLWAKVDIAIEPNTITLNESFQITLTIEDETIDTEPNLLNLQQDFYIISTEHRMSYVLNQGIAHTMSQWVVTLRPRHSGTLTIAPIIFGQQHSQSTQIIVTPNTLTTSAQT